MKLTEMKKEDWKALWQKIITVLFINPYNKIKSMTKKECEIVWDKFTTGLLIFLFCTPFLILTYILLWFVFR